MTRTIGVIGLGSIGMRHKTNLWKELKQTEVVGYDPDPDKQNGAGWVVGDIRKLVEISDLIVIASPTSLHSEYIGACEGKPLFVEKPIAAKLPVNITDVVMVGYNLRFHSCVRVAKDWINSGALGTILWANFTLGQYNAKPAYLRDGVILNWSHEIDLALYLLGPWSLVGSGTRIVAGWDDMTDILLNQSGCRTTIHLDYVTKPEIRQFVIVGTGATIIVDLVHRMAFLRSPKEEIIDSHEGHDTWDDNYIEEMQAFLDRCDGKETIGCTAMEGLEVLKICEQVRKQAGL